MPSYPSKCISRTTVNITTTSFANDMNDNVYHPINQMHYWQLKSYIELFIMINKHVRTNMYNMFGLLGYTKRYNLI